MPACYTLTKKGQTQPSDLVAVDEAMCAHFGVEPHPEKWYRNWENTIGLSIALGNSWERTKEVFPDDVDIIDWLRENYDTESWYQR